MTPVIHDNDGTANHAIDGDTTPKELKDGFKGKPRKVIALDMDDTMVQTGAGQVKLLKDLHGVDVTLDDFESYKLFQNRGWGTPQEVSKKLDSFVPYVTSYEAAEGLISAIKRLRDLGYVLYIVTARSSIAKWSITGWLENAGLTFGPGMDIEDVYFTRHNNDHEDDRQVKKAIQAIEELTEAEKEKRANRALIDRMADESKTLDGPKKKLESLKAIGATVFVDDQPYNFLPVLENTDDIHCLLFGDFKWSKNNIDFTHPHDFLTWQERQDAGVDLHIRPFPESERLHHVKTWDEVVKWVEKYDEEQSKKDL